MDDILKHFLVESKGLTGQLTSILERVEDDLTRYRELEKFGQIIDRIMGGSKILALDLAKDHPVQTIANFAEICKVIGYKASQVVNNENFTATTVAFLMDAVETLDEFYDQINAGATKDINTLVTKTFLDRLRWLATKFDENLRSTVGPSLTPQDSTQADIDALIKKMGVKG